MPLLTRSGGRPYPCGLEGRNATQWNPATLSPLSKRSEPYNLRRAVPRHPVPIFRHDINAGTRMRSSSRRRCRTFEQAYHRGEPPNAQRLVAMQQLASGGAPGNCAGP